MEANPQTRRPNFFIVGAPKCGTTSMYEYLRQHPQVFMPERKEPHFLAPELEGKWPWGVRDEADYLALFKDAGDATRIGEASVWYLYSPEAARHIREFSPDALIIAMLRNPVDMLYSLHWQYVRDGEEDIRDFGVALAAENDRRSGRRIPRAARFVRGLFYSVIPCYTEQLRRYFDVFGRERVHIIVFDDLKADAGGVYRQVVDFLGITRDFVPEFVIANPATTLPRMPFAGFVLSHPRLHAIAQAVLPLALRKCVGPVVNKFRRTPSHSPMDPAVRSRLREHFAPEVEKLSRLLDRDLTHWSRAD